jgi:hypothetical protein
MGRPVFKYFRGTLLFFIVSSFLTVSGQSVSRYSVSSGGSTGNVAASIQSNIGELAVETYASAVMTLSQGFEQNDQLPISVNAASQGFGNTRIYPNPSASVLYVEFEDDGSASIEIFDLAGRQHDVPVQKTTFSHVSAYTLDLGSLESGIYFIRLKDQKKATRNFKITKV